MINTLKYILWTILSLGMIFLAIMAFWVFLVILGIILIARFLYLKLFNKERKGTFTIHTYTVRSTPRNNAPPSQEFYSEARGQKYTTVIDADDTEKEYQIPKIK